MTHTTHSYVMIGLLAVGSVLFFSGGVGGGALFLLWPLLCMGSMFAMMWFMGGTSSRPAEHTHADGVMHTHGEVPESSVTGGDGRRSDRHPAGSSGTAS